MRTRCGAATLIAACAFAGLPLSAAAQEIRIETSRDGEHLNVKASAELRASARVAWEVISDYDHLADFIPDMTRSRVVSRDGNKVVIEQKGEVGFFFYWQPVDVVLEVLEQPPLRMDARGVSGNVRDLETSYALRATDAGVRLEYVGRFVPDFYLPPVIGIPVMRRVIERRFRAMVDEIQRRDALARGAPKQ